MTDQWEENLWIAVEEAVRKRISPKAFKLEIRACWKEALKQEAEAADRALRKEG